MKNKWVSQKVEELKLSPIRKVFNKVAQLRSKGMEIIDFLSEDLFLYTPSTIKKRLKKTLDRGMVHYTGSSGTIELKK